MPGSAPVDVRINVFISATPDLEREARALHAVLGQLHNVKTVSRELIGASPEPFSVAVGSEIAHCDVYIGLFGDSDWPEGACAAEWEYREGRAHNVPCLIYFRESSNQAADRLALLKGEMARTHATGSFRSTEDLVRHCLVDLYNLDFRTRTRQPAGAAAAAGPQTAQSADQNLLKAFGLEALGNVWRAMRAKWPAYIATPILLGTALILVWPKLPGFFQTAISTPAVEWLKGHGYIERDAFGEDWFDHFDDPAGKPSRLKWKAPPEWRLFPLKPSANIYRGLLVTGTQPGINRLPLPTQAFRDFTLKFRFTVQRGQTAAHWLARAQDTTNYYRFALRFPAVDRSRPADLTASRVAKGREMPLTLAQTIGFGPHKAPYAEGDVIYVVLAAQGSEFTITLKADDHQLRSGSIPSGPFNDAGERINVFRDLSPAPYKLGFIGFLAPDEAGPLCLNDLWISGARNQETPPPDQKGERKKEGGA